MTHHPRGHLKLTGDTHLPDLESDDLDIETGTAPLAKLARDANSPGRIPVRRAGMLRDPDVASQAGAGGEAPAAARPARSRATARPRGQASWTPWVIAGLALLLLRRLRI